MIKLWLLRFALSIFALLLIGTGGFVAGVALHDPDTCWLLSLGRWIVQHHCLPMIDPISSGVAAYATVFPGFPLMQYQWLPEIIFYGTYAFWGLTGLLVFTAVCLCATYVVIPFDLLQRSRAPYALTLLVIAVSIILSASRFLVRPQIVSFLFCSLLLDVLLSRDFKKTKCVQVQILLAALILMGWANCHILFPLGIAIVLVVAAFRIAELLLFHRGAHMPLGWLAAMPVVGFCATLINPWGIGLWLFFLRCLHSTINTLNEENAPLPLMDPSAVLLVLFFIATVLAALVAIRKTGMRRFPLVSIPLSIIAVYLGLSHSRLISFSPLLFIGAVAEIYFYRSCAPNVFRADADAPVDTAIPCAWERYTRPRYVWYGLNTAMVVIGALLVCNLLPPTLPQGSAGHDPPFEAIEYLRNNRPYGRILNDPQYGSVMSFYLSHPDVFIDTRFGQFDEERVRDYHAMSVLDPSVDFEIILAKYKFDWAFLPVKQPLSVRLRKAGWKVLYEDGKAVILKNTNKQPV